MSNTNIYNLNTESNKQNTEQVAPIPTLTEPTNFNMLKEKAQLVLDMKPFNQCFYGCRLDKNTHKWSCKKFGSVEEADNYAFQNRDSNLATRLIPVNCLESQLPDFYEKYKLFKQVNFPVDIEH